MCDRFLYLAPPSSFVDLEECQPRLPAREEAISLPQNILAKIVLAVDPAEHHAVRASQLGFADMALGVCSLTDDPVNEFMWKDYADSHRGICVELSTRELMSSLRTNQNSAFHFGPVNYMDRLTPDFNPFNKLRAFSSEREWRLVRDYGVPEWGRPKDRRLKLAPRVVTGVMVGRKTTINRARLVEEWCLSSGLPRPVRLTQSKPQPGSW